MGVLMDDGTSGFMQRGGKLEAQAASWYELQTDAETRRVGFCMDELDVCGSDGTHMVGCSPDRLIGDNGGLEIKIVAAGKHIGHLIEDFEAEYKAQVQGCMWVCDREWWDLLSWHPTLPNRIIRCTRDETFIAALATAMPPFLSELEEVKKRVRSMMPNIDDVITEMAAQRQTA
jgi:hypothetical protein